MSVEVLHRPDGATPWLTPTGSQPALRLPPGAAAAVVVAREGDGEALRLVPAGGETATTAARFVLIDLGRRRTLLYVLGDEPLYLDGREILAAVLAADSPAQRHVLRWPALAGAVAVRPARAVRGPAADDGTCAYCSGAIAAGEPVVWCGCSPDAVFHGADEGLDCWKRRPCTLCGWSLADAVGPPDPPSLRGPDHGSA